MKNKLNLIAICFLFAPCATIFSKKEYDIRITSNAKDSSVKLNDSVYKLPALISVKRSKDNLKLVFISDSLQKELDLKSRIRPYFIVGNLFFYPPFSYIVDLNNDKRFYYKNNIYIKVKDSLIGFSRISMRKKISSIFAPSLSNETGNLKFHFSLPYGNHFYFAPRAENRKSNFGFIGIATGLDYFYDNNSFLSVQADVKTSFFLPIPVPFDRVEGEYTTSSAVNFSIANNTKLNQFSYGYGLNYAINNWNYSYILYFDQSNQTNVEIRKVRANQNFGLHLNSYFQVSNNFYIGLVYQPSFVNINYGLKLQYEHSLSLDFAWKFNLLNLKK